MGKIDLTNKRFTCLKVLKDVGRSSQGKVLWKCLCDCGNMVTVQSSSLLTQHTRSCGCLKQGHTPIHGKFGMPVYIAWASMKGRCNNPNNISYPNYGGRGIKVCDRWQDFQNFYADMGASYKKGLTLDRIDNNGDYTLENCRWLTKAQQQRNRRNTIKVVYRGQQRVLIELAEEFDINAKTVLRRIQRDWRVEDAVETPVKQQYWEGRNVKFER